jgi:hypothetical protein
LSDPDALFVSQRRTDISLLEADDADKARHEPPMIYNVHGPCSWPTGMGSTLSSEHQFAALYRVHN